MALHLQSLVPRLLADLAIVPKGMLAKLFAFLMQKAHFAIRLLNSRMSLFPLDAELLLGTIRVDSFPLRANRLVGPSRIPATVLLSSLDVGLLALAMILCRCRRCNGKRGAARNPENPRHSVFLFLFAVSTD
jgi:hypothetical protein